MLNINTSKKQGVNDITQDSVPPVLEKMYQVPGSPRIDNNALDRYIDDTGAYQARILKIVDETKTTEMSVDPKEAETECIRHALEHGTLNVKIEAAGLINYTPNHEQAALRQIVPQIIRLAFEHGTLNVKLEAVWLIDCAPENDEQTTALRQIVPQIIRDAFEHGTPDIKLEAAGLIDYAPENDEQTTALRQIVPQIIRDAFEHGAPNVKLKAAGLIYCVPEGEQVALRQMVAQKIRHAFQFGTPDLKLEAVGLIDYAPNDEQAALKQKVPQIIRHALEDGTLNVKLKAAGLIYCVPENAQMDLLELATKKTNNAIIAPALYHDGNRDGKFFREPFVKTGSETTLLGGNLKNKLIIRHLEPKHFLVWQKLYKDYDFWKNLEFDYVPIEPIVSYRLGKDDKVAVFTGVLDLSLAKWKKITSLYNDELQKQKKAILCGLRQKGIEHGYRHDHDGNFCLRFFRDEHGNPMMDIPPRLYLIDFDMATFS